MKRFLKLIVIIVILAIGIFFLYCNNTSFVNERTLAFYQQLKDSLKKRGYKDKLLVISTKRFKWHNDIQVKLTGAASKSRHISGEAIDFIVFDINSDGKSDSADINIVADILDKEIIKGKGGIGTYKTESSFLNKQMIHIDCRGYRARWR